MTKIVLVVEDEEAIQDIIKLYMGTLDVELLHAYNGEDGIRKYREALEKGQRPDAVIMDIKLPGMDGIETTRKIKQLDANAIIFGFTAFQSHWAQEMRKAGATKVIPRHMGFSVLREILRTTWQHQDFSAR